MQSPVDMLKEMHANILFKALEDKARLRNLPCMDFLTYCMQLPCNSGLYLSAAESDLAQVIGAINRIVARSPDRVVSRLCSILEKLRKVDLSFSTIFTYSHLLVYPSVPSQMVHSQKKCWPLRLSFSKLWHSA